MLAAMAMLAMLAMSEMMEAMILALIGLPDDSWLLPRSLIERLILGDSYSKRPRDSRPLWRICALKSRIC
jgi:hypothetical protein